MTIDRLEQQFDESRLVFQIELPPSKISLGRFIIMCILQSANLKYYV